MPSEQPNIRRWDPPGLPPRTREERCARHRHCAYRDDDPVRCPLCHSMLIRCEGKHGGAVPGGHGSGQAGPHHPTLRAGQYLDPRDEERARAIAEHGPAALEALLAA